MKKITQVGKELPEPRQGTYPSPRPLSANEVRCTLSRLLESGAHLPLSSEQQAQHGHLYAPIEKNKVSPQPGMYFSSSMNYRVLCMKIWRSPWVHTQTSEAWPFAYGMTLASRERSRQTRIYLFHIRKALPRGVTSENWFGRRTPTETDAGSGSPQSTQEGAGF